jgi:c-di-GMP phosphodiesterase
MNAPDRLGLSSILGALSMSYAPLVDRSGLTYGTRLTMLSVRPQDRLPVGLVLDQLNALWPESVAPVLVAPLDGQFDESLLDWDAPRNALLEVPSIALRDPKVQSLVQRARRHGIHMAMRGRPDVPLPPALLDCFDFALIHVTEDRRRRNDGSTAPPPPGVVRRVPFIITGAFRKAELEAAYERGAVASVGVPLDEGSPTIERPPRPGQSTVLEALRLAHDKVDFERICDVVRRDPALTFELIRLANTTFAVPVQTTSVKRALMVLGHQPLARWLGRMLRVACPESDALPLAQSALRRGLFLEHLASCSPDGAELRDALFLTGSLSLMDRATGTSLPRLFENATLPAQVSAALLERVGPCAGYLSLIEAIERSDPMNSRKHREALSIDLLDCNLSLLRALSAAQTIPRTTELLAA